MELFKLALGRECTIFVLSHFRVSTNITAEAKRTCLISRLLIYFLFSDTFAEYPISLISGSDENTLLRKINRYENIVANFDLPRLHPHSCFDRILLH